MTRNVFCIARRLFALLFLAAIGCNATQHSTPPNEGDAAMAAARLGPVAGDKNAAALQQLLQSSDESANAVRAIDAAHEVVVNNIANQQTTAYKAGRVLFEGGGKIAVQLDMGQGSLENTGQSLDVAIQGGGFFQLKPEGNQHGVLYTRAGNLNLNSTGELILAVGSGYTLVPPITLPLNATNISIGVDGTVQYVKAGTTAKTTAGQIRLAIFSNPQAMHPVTANIFAQTPASGSPMTCYPGSDDAGQLIAGYLESANVDSTRETMRLQALDKWRATLLRAMGVRE